MLKVATIVGTRPEIIKMARVIAALDEHFDHHLIHTGQNYDYELNEVFFDDLEIRQPDHFLEAAGASAAETIARVIERSDKLLSELRPDALAIYGDTNSCLAVIAAKRLKIPIFHFEAGNRCFDQRVPEELNRKIVDHLSDVNFVLSEHARRYLAAEGLPQDRIFKSGSHLPEVLDYYAAKIAKSDVLDRHGVAPGDYCMVSAHREENVDEPARLRNLLESLKQVQQKFGKKVLVSVHPRTAKRLADLDDAGPGEEVVFLKPFAFTDYIRLQKDAFCVLSDSGTITEEASLLGFCAINLRRVHERPEGVDEAATIQADLTPERVVAAVEMATKQYESGFRPRVVEDYQDAGRVSEKAVRIIASYTDVINEYVWHKPARS